MRWANFIHIYQPAGQQPDILAAVTTQSYRPILEGIRSSSGAKLTLNINGVLLETFDKFGYRDLIDILRQLIQEGKIELTGSAKYHAFLPFLSEKEIIRQVEENMATLDFYFNHYKPVGFFPPEMAYDEKIVPIIEQLGYKWIILDEIACGGKTGQVDYTKIYKIKKSSVSVFFRERRPSNLIMSAIVRSYKSLREAMSKDFTSNRYLITGMDGETFGHHRPGLEKLFFEMLNSKECELLKISELVDFYKDTIEISPVKSTWASNEKDIEHGIQFLSWRDPENEIHHWQWELVELTLNSVYELKERHPRYKEIRKNMDEALASDHFWWASAKPWWSIEEIERGAFMCLSILRTISGIHHDKIEQARHLYEKIVSTAFQWKRSGKIDSMMQEQRSIVRIPFKERTLERGGREAGVYQAFINMFKRLEREAASRGDYEKAVLWRDAVYKIENKSDIYDAVHAIDLLRLEISNEEVERTLDQYTEKYHAIRGGQPEQRG